MACMQLLRAHGRCFRGFAHQFASAAGLTSTIICFPLETVRTRLAVAPVGEFHGMIHCARQVCYVTRLCYAQCLRWNYFDPVEYFSAAYLAYFLFTMFDSLSYRSSAGTASARCLRCGFLSADVPSAHLLNELVLRIFATLALSSGKICRVQGLNASMIGVVPYAALRFAAYDG